MSQCLNLLDQALDLGQRELEFLHAGKVEETEEAARERSALMEKAWKAEDISTVQVEDLLGKLHKLKGLQGQLTREARSLHKSLEEDLARTKQERVRMSGYRQGNSGRSSNRFLFKKKG